MLADFKIAVNILHGTNDRWNSQ